MGENYPGNRLLSPLFPKIVKLAQLSLFKIALRSHSAEGINRSRISRVLRRR